MKQAEVFVLYINIIIYTVFTQFKKTYVFHLISRLFQDTKQFFPRTSRHFCRRKYFSYYIVEIDHCYHTVPFIFSEIDKLTFPFIYAIFSISFLLIY